jgi:undecaprenyl-phosphate galactose phosphotransferase/putative colanic acid biosynthesis UDP-glucose lipid carrier transferase
VHIARQSSYAARPPALDFSLPCQALPPIAAGIDLGLLVAASFAGAVLYQYWATNHFAAPDGVTGIGLTCAALFVLMARIDGLYELQALLAPPQNLARLTAMLAMSLLAAICLLFLFKVGEQYSRGAMVVFSGFAFALLPVGRLLFGAAARSGVVRGVVKGRRVITLGDMAELERLSATDFLQFGIDEAARFALSGSLTQNGGLSARDRMQIAGAIEASRELRAVEFALILPWSRDGELSELCALLRISPLAVRLYPDQRIRSVLHQRKERGYGQHFSVKVQREPLSGMERALKRGLDVAVASAALLVLSPLLLLISLAIKLDGPGPVIFRQRRCGFDNREFVILKFRTMTVMEDDGPIVQARRDDRRVSRIGKVLRRTSIDELPQLLNVLRGEMSVVGPRPHAIAHDDEFKARIRDYALRHHVKPGVTGAAQVMGLRGETQHLSQMEQRVERDLWYIKNWSLTLDLKILAMTCVALLRHDAY